jgi:lambda family phage minor tail protein L
MPIIADLASLDPGTLVELYVLDLSPVGGPQLFFHAGTNQLNLPVVWQGNTYQPYPIQTSGFEWHGSGQLPRPKLQVANVVGLITGYLLAYGDLAGVPVKRQRTLVKYLDVVNFPDSINPTADPSQQMPDEIWLIDRKSAENKIFVEFELAAGIDVAGVMLPRRQIVQNLCSWKYRSADCSWVPTPTGPFFDRLDQVTTDAALDDCSLLVTGCKCRFGATAALPYGGFPAAGLVKQ